jgi:hypothetical protein
MDPIPVSRVMFGVKQMRVITFAYLLRREHRRAMITLKPQIGAIMVAVLMDLILVGKALFGVKHFQETMFVRPEMSDLKLEQTIKKQGIGFLRRNPVYRFQRCSMTEFYFIDNRRR